MCLPLQPVVLCASHCCPPLCSYAPLQVKQLAQEVAQLFRNVVSLSVKLRDSTLAQVGS